MKYLKYFKTEANWTAYKDGNDYILPNVSYVEETKGVSYAPYVSAPIGASIYGVDGKFYSADEWTSAGKSNSDAVGVAVSNGEHSFVIHPTAEQASIAWSSNTSVRIDGVFTTEDRATAGSDFAGESNTAAILAAVQAGTIVDAPAAQYAAGITFANGKKGYLPSAGELTLAYTKIGEINNCLSNIGGTTFQMAIKCYWSSTQYNSTNAWGSSSSIKINAKYGINDRFVRVVAAL